MNMQASRVFGFLFIEPGEFLSQVCPAETKRAKISSVRPFSIIRRTFQDVLGSVWPILVRRYELLKQHARSNLRVQKIGFVKQHDKRRFS